MKKGLIFAAVLAIAAVAVLTSSSVHPSTYMAAVPRPGG
jgi:hypothetical protein